MTENFTFKKFVLEALFFNFIKFGYYTNISRVNFILFFSYISAHKHGVIILCKIKY